jgi:3-deoxy-D-manno-octulosonate 8-phosphate phosphatase (KDO 8-P phosphatase)
MEKIPAKLRNKIKLVSHLILDVDGVLTDGRIILDDRGRELKFFDVRDGHGMKLLMRAGLEIIILTGRSSRVVDHRAKELGIKDVHQGARNKIDLYAKILKSKNLTEDKIACMGDDLTDIPILRRSGFSIAPADASDHVKELVDFVTTHRGGRGAVRELCELILHVQGKWNEVTARYSPEAHG